MFFLVSVLVGVTLFSRHFNETLVAELANMKDAQEFRVSLLVNDWLGRGSRGLSVVPCYSRIHSDSRCFMA